MKRNLLTLMLTAVGLVFSASFSYAQAPQGADDVMLQAFYWDSNGSDTTYGTTKWSNLLEEASEITTYFDLVWLPPSSLSEGGVGYHPRQWSNQNSDWGTAAQLKSLISALNDGGANVVADIVINHRGGATTWNDFLQDSYGLGYTTYSLTSAHICSDDECTASGYSATGNSDAGYETLTCNGKTASGAYCAARDLDHSNSYVQEDVKTYLKFLMAEYGYNGWRYDLVKGYLGSYNKIYNDAAGAYFSVGEYWDGSYDAVKNWIDATGRTSNAFDFPLKYAAFNNGLASSNYGALVSGYGTYQGLAGGSGECGYSVTFVDNHDTFRDSNQYTGDWSRAYAYLLAGPGIPCVFWPHWYMMKDQIKAMIQARKACGITNTSSASTSYTNGYYEGTTTGTKGTLKCFIGASNSWSAPSGYTLACSGDGWAYYTTVEVSDLPVVTMTPASGNVGQGGTVTLSSTGTSPTIYYTTDGSTPSTSSTVYTGPITITTNGTTIKAIAYDSDGNASSVVSGTFYTQSSYDAVVTVVSSGNPLGTSAMYIYAWDENETALAGSWPGTAMSKNDKGNWYYTLSGLETSYNVVINAGSNTAQTVDITGLTSSVCIEVSSTMTSSKYDYEIVDCAGLAAVDETNAVEMAIYYDKANKIVTVSSEETVKNITLIDLNGNDVLSSASESINVSDLQTALYFVKVEFENGGVSVGKIIK